MDGGILHTQTFSSNEINQNLVYLTENITNLHTILIHLVERGIVSEDERQLIDSERTDLRKNSHLLSLLQKKNWPEPKPVFVQILRNTGNEHCAELIEEHAVHNLNQNSDLGAQWWPEEKTLPKAFLERKSENCLLIDTLKNYMSRSESEGMAVITQQVTVSGLGGIGKTTTAIWFAQQYGKEYDHIVWIDCGEKSLLNSFKKLAVDLDMKNRSEKNHDVKWLATSSFRILKEFKCLLIFDNAECYMGNEGIKDVLPNTIKNFDVLITSRNKLWGDANGEREIPQFELDVFNQNESVEFMKKHIKVLPENVYSQLHLLCDLLGNLPLAIQIAIATLNRQNVVKLETYIDKIQNTPAEILHAKFDKYEHTIYKTMKISLDLIQHHETNDERKIGETALRILSIFGFITPDNVEAKFFMAVETKILTLWERIMNFVFIIDYQTATFSEAEIHEAVNVLEVYSLITRNNISENEYTLNIHRLLQQVIRHNFKNSEEQILTQILNCDGNLKYKLIPFCYADENLQKKFPKIKSELIDKIKLSQLLRERRFEEAVKLSRIIRSTLKNPVSDYNFLVCLQHNNELSEFREFKCFLESLIEFDPNQLQERTNETVNGYFTKLQIIESIDQLNKNIVMSHLFLIYLYEKNFQRARRLVLIWKHVTLPLLPLNDLNNFLNLMSLSNLFLERHENENCITLRVKRSIELTMKLELHFWVLDENTQFHQDLQDLVLVNCVIFTSKNPFLKAKNITLLDGNIGYKHNEDDEPLSTPVFVTNIFDFSKVENIMIMNMQIKLPSNTIPRETDSITTYAQILKLEKDKWLMKNLFLGRLDLYQKTSITVTDMTMEHCSIDISILPPALKKLTLFACTLINYFKSNSVKAQSKPNCLKELSLINICVKDMKHGEQCTPVDISHFITPKLKKLKVSNFPGKCVRLSISLNRLTSIQSLYLAECALVVDRNFINIIAPIELTLKNVSMVDTIHLILNDVLVNEFVNFNQTNCLCLTGMSIDFSEPVSMEELILRNANTINWECGRWIVEKCRIFPSPGPTDMKIDQLVITEDEDETKNSSIQSRKEELLKYFKSISGVKTISGLYHDRGRFTANEELETFQNLFKTSPGILTTEMPQLLADTLEWQSFIDQTISNWNNGHLVHIRCDYNDILFGIMNSLMTDNAAKKILDTLAFHLQQLQTAGVVAICNLLPWRDYASNHGIKRYQMTREYLTQHHGLSSIIWVWSIHADEDMRVLKKYWPGDNYVDVVSVSSSKPLTSTGYQKVLETVGDKPISMELLDNAPTHQLLVTQSRWVWFTIYSNHLQRSNSFAKTEEYKQIETILNSPSVITRSSHEMLIISPD